MKIITIIILFLFCTLLLAAELFILPGTGVAGIAAICCLVGANYFTFVWFGLTTGLWLSAASLVACILVGYWTPPPPHRINFPYSPATKE